MGDLSGEFKGNGSACRSDRTAGVGQISGETRMTHLRISWAQQQQATGTAEAWEDRAAADGRLASVARPLEGRLAPDPEGHSGWVA